ncbi:MAG: 16S rRNA (cytosine(1402)-N(4))-methyltransferase RsmH, partial [Oscillospiraceae bacterium]
EKFASKIAFEICKARESSPIKTTFELNEIIKKAIPFKAARNDTKNPCRRTYQAIRIETNNELGVLKTAIEEGFELLNSGGRFCIITFHSLEDRIVKQAFLKFAQGCECPPEFPICVCNKTPRGKIITKKPIVANEDECNENPRSRSAKLRIIEKV